MAQASTGHIESKPAVCGGKPCIVGTRIRVQDVYVWHHLQGQSVDEIASRFPQVSMADVYAALAYFWDHRQEMQEQMRAETEFVEQLKQKSPSPLQAKLAGNSSAGQTI